MRSLQILWCWAAGNRPSGDLTGLDEEDITIAADWAGEAELFVNTLSSIGFLDGEACKYSLHGWQENNSWAASEPSRGDKGHFSKLKSMDSTKAVAQKLEDAGITRVSKTDYVALTDETTCGETLQRILGSTLGNPDMTQ